MSKWIPFVVYVALIWAANLAIERWGFVSVGFGLMAPAGVWFAGLAFSARDWTQEWLGRRWVVVAILVGAAVSWLISPAFAVASGAAFLASETVDFAAYTFLRRRNRYAAVIVSNAVGSVIDSLLFLYLAFGSTRFWEGQVVGKLWTVIPAVVLIWLWRSRDLSQRMRARRSPTGGGRDA